MDFWPEFLATSWGREFVAGGFGGAAGVISGYPLDTLRIRLQQPSNPTRSAVGLLRHIVASEGASALYRGMAAPLASVTFQNALVFQTFAVLSRAFDSSTSTTSVDPPSYRSVALAGFGTGALQSFLLSPVELVKIRLQIQQTNGGGSPNHHSNHHLNSPTAMAKYIFRREGFRGIFRGLGITVLRDAPAHGVYFWTYERAREQLHPGCRKSGKESLNTMLVAGGLAGVASWVCCYPLDVVKTRLQSQTQVQSPSPWDKPLPKYSGIIDCLHKSVKEEGLRVLWRGLGTAIIRAFVVNGAIFAAYEVSLRGLFTNKNQGNIQAEKNRLLEKPV